MFRLWVADLDSPSYFVAVAAIDLGFFEQEGLDVELVHKANDGPERLRAGAIDFVAGPAYAALQAFPAWKGAKLLCALSQYSYWFLALRADLDVTRGDIEALKGLRLSASTPWPDMGLRHMLQEAGLDLARDRVEIVAPPPSKTGFKARSGVDAIEQNIADGYWGNGMRVAVGESLGAAKLHLDLRRGDGPPGARHYNFAALTTTQRLVDKRPDVAKAAIRAVVRTQKALRGDPSLATAVGLRLFPPDEAALIAPLIERDAPYYDAAISREAVDGLMGFATAFGLIDAPTSYERVVAAQFGGLWTG